MTKRILMLFSDTGGGHRSAAEALAEALTAQYGAGVDVHMVDVLKNYAPYPFNRLPAWYPLIIRYGSRAWGGGFRMTDGVRRTRAMIGLIYPYVRRAVRRLAREYPADIVVSLHPLLTAPMARALGPDRPPLVTVVTDLVSIHAFWYYPKVDMCIVPTEQAGRSALRSGLPAEKVRVVGLPVAARFCVPVGEKAELRRRLGWGIERPVVMVVGGGEGMGPLAQIARAISESRLPCELVVVAGRNQSLRAELSAAAWNVPAHIYGFVTEMPDFMRAADVLVTKAGPGTICEALNAGLPMILYGYLPGQEAGNIGYVTDEGAGQWAPGPQRVVDALRRWIGPAADPGALPGAAENARRLARPDAAREVAETVFALADRPRTRRRVF